MTKIILSILLTIEILLLASCMPIIPEGHYFTPTKKSPPVNFAMVYIYNPYPKTEEYSNSKIHNDIPTIFVDNKEVVTLPAKTYTTVLLSIGPHVGGILYKETEQVIFTKPKPKHFWPFFIGNNETYYLRFYRKLQKTNFTTADPTMMTPSNTYYFPSNLKLLISINPKTISNCRYVIPKITKIGVPIS